VGSGKEARTATQKRRYEREGTRKKKITKTAKLERSGFKEKEKEKES
jgi:hypothetical protein